MVLKTPSTTYDVLIKLYESYLQLTTKFPTAYLEIHKDGSGAVEYIEDGRSTILALFDTMVQGIQQIETINTV